MVKTIQEEFLYKKGYEFSYAVLRIASSFRTESSGRMSAKNREIAELLEVKAVLLLDSILTADYEKTKDLIHSIITITGLMVDSGILHPVNREILISESERINLAIKALPERIKTLPDLNLGKIFSKTILPINPVRSSPPQRPLGRASAGTTSNGVKKQIADKIADKSETRQSAIIEKVRQTENCRLNELQAIFPDISERTLRYDLESLILKGLVERIGSRRNSFYKITRLPPARFESRSESGGSPAAQAVVSGQENSKSAVIELPAHSATNPGLTQ